MNWLAFFQNLKAVVLSIGAEHLLNDFSSVSLMARETSCILSSHHFCEACGIISNRLFFENGAVEAFFDFFQ